MELKDFIKAAITDITDAISELQEELDNGTIVNPALLPQGDAKNCVLVGDDIRKIENLNFDVAVTISKSDGVGGSAKAGISIFGANIDTSSNAKKENASRLTFSIPIVYPSAHIESPLDKIEAMYSKRSKDIKD